MHAKTFLPLCASIAASLLLVQESFAEPKGISIHIGLNHIDPDHYAGDDGELFGCINDANDMADIADSYGFEVWDLILEEDGTRENVLNKLEDAAQELQSGDILLLTYSGHGSHVWDENGDEPDELDETLCLYDGQLIDDELFAAWGAFDDVRILFISDSCRSGSVAKQVEYQRFGAGDIGRLDIARPDSVIRGLRGDTNRLVTLRDAFGRQQARGGRDRSVRVPPVEAARYRYLPANIAYETWLDNRDEYREWGTAKELAGGDRARLRASVLLLSGCQDSQFSQDGWGNGKFTGQLKEVLASASDHYSNYPEFHRLIVDGDDVLGIAGMPPTQTPNYFWATPRNLEFEDEKPFSISE